MRKWWEDVLGQRVLFLESPDGRWQWALDEPDIRHDPSVRFHSLQAARLACAAMIYGFFVMEEVTSDPVPSSIRPSDATDGGRGLTGSSPTQGSGGGN